MNKHPHAELMKQYAEDAMKTTKPWRLWEIRKLGDNTWYKLIENPTWLNGCEYRRIPRVVEIDGVEFPQKAIIMSGVPTFQDYFTITIDDSGFVPTRINHGRMNIDKFHALYEQGLIFETLEDCEHYIKALIELNKKIASRFDKDSGKEN